MPIRCNLSEADQTWALRNDFIYSAEAQDFIESRFHHYLFYDYAVSDQYCRPLVETECTCCNKKQLWAKTDWDYFRKEKKIKHTEKTVCPDCGSEVTAYTRGKIGKGIAISQERIHALILKEIGGDLYAAAVTASKFYGRIETEPAEVALKATYYFSAGKCQKWRIAWVFQQKENRWEPKLIAQKTLTEPFPNLTCCSYYSYGDPTYTVFGLSEIEKSCMKYCGYREYWEGLHNMSLCDGQYLDGFMTYLSIYAKYPKMEMLSKGGLYEIISNALEGNMHGKALNWRAKTLDGFLKLSKSETKQFIADRTSVRILETKKRCGVSLQDAKDVFQYIGDEWDQSRMLPTAKEVGTDIAELARYLHNQKCRVEIWTDYIKAAEKMNYDLTRKDVIFPKDLMTAHDAATKAAEWENEKLLQKGYEKRYKVLEKKYGFSMDGLCVMVPKNPESIVREGHVLSHCVGGYAARHMEGKTTILFLRRKKKPNTPYITIEMDGKRIVQIHGYKNERVGNYQSGFKNLRKPMEKHGHFINTWLSWLKSGSKRNKDGTPKLPVMKERKSA